MKLDCLPSCSQLIKEKRKKNLTSIQSNHHTIKINGLYILQGEFLGTQLLIRSLILQVIWIFLFLRGTLSLSFGPIVDAVSMSYLQVHGMLR